MARSDALVVLFSGANSIGGGEISLLDLADLMKGEWDLALVTPDPYLAERWKKVLEDEKGESVLISSFPSLKLKSSHAGKIFLEGTRVLGWLRRIKKKGQKVLFLVNTAYSVPVVRSLQWFFPLAKMIATIRTEIPLDHIVRDRYFFSRLDGLVFSSNYLRRLVEVGLRSRVRCEVIYPFVYRGQLQFKDRSFASPLKIGIVGSVSPWKGQDLVLDMAKALKDEEFFVFGSDGDREFAERLRSRQREENIKNLYWMGWIEDVSKIYDQIDLVVVPSKGEGFGRVIPEAFFSGVLVLASNNSALAELIEDGQTGFLLDRGALDSWIERLLWVRRHPEEAKKVVKKALSVAQEIFNEERIRLTWRDYVQSILSNG